MDFSNIVRRQRIFGFVVLSTKITSTKRHFFLTMQRVNMAFFLIAAVFCGACIMSTSVLSAASEAHWTQRHAAQNIALSGRARAVQVIIGMADSDCNPPPHLLDQFIDCTIS